MHDAEYALISFMSVPLCAGGCSLRAVRVGFAWNMHAECGTHRVVSAAAAATHSKFLILSDHYFRTFAHVRGM